MAFITAAALAITVAFPKPAQVLPPVSSCYMIGAVPRGVTNLVVQGKAVDVYRTGGWVTMVDVEPGKNTIAITAGDVATNVVLTVEKPRPPKLDAEGKPVVVPPKVYEKLAYAADEPQARPFGKAPGEILVVLDPGHGGSGDTGAMSPHGFCEKDANLALARDVRTALLARGYQVLMTRDADEPVALLERGRAACERKADAFISLHHNAPGCSTDPRKVRYTCVYEWNAIGRELATAIDARLGAALEGDIPNNGVLHANFAVTRNPQVPSCLVETDFITTPQGEEAIWNPPRRRLIAEAIAAGFADWCTPPASTNESPAGEKGAE